jgi:hypothetical protein
MVGQSAPGIEFGGFGLLVRRVARRKQRQARHRHDRRLRVGPDLRGVLDRRDRFVDEELQFRVPVDRPDRQPLAQVGDDVLGAREGGRLPTGFSRTFTA